MLLPSPGHHAPSTVGPHSSNHSLYIIDFILIVFYLLFAHLDIITILSSLFSPRLPPPRQRLTMLPRLPLNSPYQVILLPQSPE